MTRPDQSIRPFVILSPMMPEPQASHRWDWLAPVVCFLSIAAPLLLKL